MIVVAYRVLQDGVETYRHEFDWDEFVELAKYGRIGVLDCISVQRFQAIIDLSETPPTPNMGDVSFKLSVNIDAKGAAFKVANVARVIQSSEEQSGQVKWKSILPKITFGNQLIVEGAPEFAAVIHYLTGVSMLPSKIPTLGILSRKAASKITGTIPSNIPSEVRDLIPK